MKQPQRGFLLIILMKHATYEKLVAGNITKTTEILVYIL